MAGVVLAVLLLVMCGGGLAVTAASLVPAVYVFGDSTVDVGNNGPLPPPYGIDFPHDSGPTGRVSNGYNIADAFAKLLGFDMSPPAYMTLTPETSRDILRGFGGVNYASAGSGILNATRMMKNSISLAEQLDFFAATKSEMAQYAGGTNAGSTLMSESLFLISSGGNDFFDYLQHLDSRLPPTYSLLNNYAKYVRALYDLGARRFGIVNVPPIGCVPLLRNQTRAGGCLRFANSLALVFNTELLRVMKKFAADPERPGITYSVGSSIKVVKTFTNDPESGGFTEVAGACCGDGRLGVESLCGPNTQLCGNRDSHLYWDFAHSSQATAMKGAAIIFDTTAAQGFAKPINFRELVSSTFQGFSSS